MIYHCLRNLFTVTNIFYQVCVCYIYLFYFTSLITVHSKMTWKKSLSAVRHCTTNFSKSYYVYSWQSFRGHHFRGLWLSLQSFATRLAPQPTWCIHAVNHPMLSWFVNNKWWQRKLIHIIQYISHDIRIGSSIFCPQSSQHSQVDYSRTTAVLNFKTFLFTQSTSCFHEKYNFYLWNCELLYRLQNDNWTRSTDFSYLFFHVPTAECVGRYSLCLPGMNVAFGYKDCEHWSITYSRNNLLFCLK